MTGMAGPTTARTLRQWPGRGLALLVAGTFFMENLDGTIIANAAPSMAASFRVAPVDINTAMTAYLVTLAVGIPVSGWLAGRMGARTVFGAAVVVFTVSSGLCALSTSLGMLTVMRVVQGIGGAMMVPVGRLVVLRATEKRDLVRAIAYLTWPGLVAPLLAPILGGVLVSYASWRWIFVINIPLGVLAGVLALRMMPAGRATDATPLDWPGFLLVGTSMAGIVLGMEAIGGATVSWPLVSVAFGTGIVLGVFAVLRLLRGRHPLVDLRVLKVRGYRVATVSGSVFRAVVQAIPFLLPLLFQDGFGWSPVRSGAMVVAVFAGNIGVKPFTTAMMRRFGFRTSIALSITGLVASLVVCALLHATTPLWLILVVLCAGGAFRSTGFTAYNSLQFADVDAADLTPANTLAATMQQLANGLGVAVGALALRFGGVAFGGTGAFPVAFAVLAVLGAACTIGLIRLPANTGDAVSRAR
jgi:EmrB/QacA subfamily drug resistance transporter